MQLVADIVAQELKLAGVDLAFGVAGGEILRLIDSLAQAGVRYVSSRHEAAAGFMADGSYRAGQTLGLMLATLGPGVANAIGCAAHALQDGVPLIILGGRVGLDAEIEFRHQVIDQLSLFKPVTKASWTLQAEAPRAIIRAAIALALSEPFGPVYLDCPQDVVEQKIAEAPVAASPPPIAAAETKLNLAQLPQLVARSQRPLVLAGLGALRPGVPSALQRFIEASRIPLITTYRAKGILPEAHPQVIAAAGLSPLADQFLLPLVADADLVLLVGYDPVEMRANWNRPFHRDAQVWTLGPAAAERAGPVATAAIEGPLPELLDSLTELHDQHHERQAWREAAATTREQLRTAFASREPWEPAALFHNLRRLIPADALVAVDTGAHRILLSQCWEMEQPGLLLQSSGFCTMAGAIPLAIGAKVRAPHREVYAVVGDGGLEMAAGELATIRELGLDITIIVVDDGGYSLIDMKQRARGFNSNGVVLGRSDYRALAQSFGGAGERAEDLQTFQAAWSARRPSQSFTIIHTVFERGTYDGRI